MTTYPKHWYKLIGTICAFLFLFMVYRREARIRMHIEKLDTRVAMLERYTAALQDRANDTTRWQGAAAPVASLPVERNGYTRTYERSTRQTTPKDTVRKPADPDLYPGKYREVVRLELNTIDSATLVRVPGIGEGTARTILRYRKQLGGFYSTDQLREKLTWDGAQKYMDSWCNEWFWVDEYFMQMLDINNLSFKELLNHPYLEFNDVKAICRWRDRYGALRNAAELQQVLGADSAKMEKLLHYVEFTDVKR
ncbi:MAG: helix-hairpin-helix domain-containing protein [Bacteroidales bacterium]|nr:helix-hairpin-helix domain-containing protein [Bacteroidales bacterium]